MRRAGLLLVALAWAAPASADPPTPLTPQVRIAWHFDRSDLTPDPRIPFGVLANGMRYAILPNRTPSGAVSVRLLVKVGATNGAPGEAHYLEHMAFMGSRNVPEGARARLSGREHLREGTGTTPIPAISIPITGSIWTARTARRWSGCCSCCATWRAN